MVCIKMFLNLSNNKFIFIADRNLVHEFDYRKKIVRKIFTFLLLILLN